jgi:hypothetical protein
MAATLQKIADIAQWVEREPSKLNVVGSKPSVRSISGVPVSRHLREIEETIWRRVCCRRGFMALGKAVQREIPVRLDAGRPHSGTAEMDVVFEPASSRHGLTICHVRLVAQDTRFSFL